MNKLSNFNRQRERVGKDPIISKQSKQGSTFKLQYNTQFKRLWMERGIMCTDYLLTFCGCESTHIIK